MKDEERPLRVFLCHASGDRPAVTKLYERLVKDGVDAWLDKEKLIPGQDWQVEIPKAVKNSDVVIVCLSSQSVTKEGFVQKEIRFALDAADEKPDGTIFIIPTRLENCPVPDRINRFHWVDLFLDDGYEKLFKALIIRATELKITLKKSAILRNPSPEKLPPSQRKASWLFLPFWTIVSLAGVAIGLSIMSILNLDFFPFVVMGLAMGIGQWMLLYGKISNSGWWVLTSVIGFTVAGIGDGAIVIESLYTGVIYGLVAGIGQWLLLRQQIDNSKIWIIFCALSWGATWAFGLLLESYGVSIGTGFWVLGLIFGVLGGGSTGGMMVWLLNQRHYNPKRA